MQSMTYFRETYGIEQSITMFHRLRAWYNRQAKIAEAEGKSFRAAGMKNNAAVMTAYIKASRQVWQR